MRVIIIDGRWPVLKCPWCNTTFHGPKTAAWEIYHVAVCEGRAKETGRFYALLGG